MKKSQPRLIELGPTIPRLHEGHISLHADNHRPEEGSMGCTCGFGIWSGEHVAVMAYREACESLGIRP